MMHLELDVSDAVRLAERAKDQLGREWPRAFVRVLQAAAAYEKKNHAFDNYSRRLQKSIRAEVRPTGDGAQVTLCAGTYDGSNAYASIVEERGRMNMAGMRAKAKEFLDGISRSIESGLER